MNTDKQISRGVERLMCLDEGARLEGLYGLAGMGDVDNFGELEGAMVGAGVPGAVKHVKLLRAQHQCACDKLRRALPIAARAMQLVDAAGDAGLSGVFSKIGKALKKVGKVAVKLSPSHALIKKIPALKKISPAFRVAEGNTPLIQAAVGPPPPTDPAVRAQLAADKEARRAAKRAAKQAKKDAKAAAALAASATPGMTPAQAGAAVLQDQSGVNLGPAGQQFAQDTVANAAFPGSALPSDAMFNAQPSDAAAAAPGGLSPAVMIAGAAAALGLLYFATRKR
jgi:hypothetical protein